MNGSPNYTIEVRWPHPKFAILRCGKCQGEIDVLQPDEKLWKTLIRYAQHKCPISRLDLPLQPEVQQ